MTSTLQPTVSKLTTVLVQPPATVIKTVAIHFFVIHFELLHEDPWITKLNRKKVKYQTKKQANHVNSRPSPSLPTSLTEALTLHGALCLAVHTPGSSSSSASSYDAFSLPRPLLGLLMQSE